MKYKDKIQLFQNCIYEMHGCYAYTLDDVLDRFTTSNYYIDEQLNMLTINIINMNEPSTIGFVPESANIDDYTGINAIKLSEFAERREIYISKDLTEVYGESFEINATKEKTGGQMYIFDYNIIYGDFRCDKGYVYTSDYYKDEYESLIDGEICLKDMYFKALAPISKDIKFNPNSDVSYMVIGGLFKTKDSMISLKPYEFGTSEFLPSSTLKYVGVGDITKPLQDTYAEKFTIADIESEVC